MSTKFFVPARALHWHFTNSSLHNFSSKLISFAREQTNKIIIFQQEFSND
jgi:hypothetical protein